MSDGVTPNSPRADAEAANVSGAAARARRRRSKERALVGVIQVGLIILLIAGMYILNATAGNLTMPRPDAVLDAFWTLWADGTMWRALLETLEVFALGFVIAATTGILGGILLGGFRLLGRVFDPFVNAINSTPSAAFVPLIIVWFGLYTEAKVVLVWLASLFPILISTSSGVDHTDNDLVEMGRSFGASRARLFWQVMLPYAVPSILAGLRIGAAVAVVGTVLAELLMAQSGLGGLLAAAGNRFQMDRYFAVVVVLMALGTLITLGVRYAETRLARWRVAQREANR